MALPSVNPEPRAAPAGGTDGERPPVVRRVAAPLAWTAALLAGSRSALCLRVLPCLGVLRGPLAILLLALGTAVALAPVLPRFRRPNPRPLVLLLVAWVFLAVVGLSYTLRLRVS